MIASSSVRIVSRTSSVPVPSGPIKIQSPVVLPSICPRRRSPRTLTLVQSTISRVPAGPVPTSTAGLLSSRIVHSGTSSIAMILPFSSCWRPGRGHPTAEETPRPPAHVGRRSGLSVPDALLDPFAEGLVHVLPVLEGALEHRLGHPVQ